jgi:hypothetical protein
MKRTAFSCALFVVLAILAMPIAPAAQGHQPGPPDLATRGHQPGPPDLSGVMGGTFTFDYYGYGTYDFITHGDATGTLKDLGLARMYTAHQVNPIADGTLIGTSFRIVAANGDEIRGTYADARVTEAGAIVTVFPYYYYYSGKATLVITGGTGHFAHAHGRINATFFEAIKLFDAYWTQYDCSVAWALGEPNGEDWGEERGR